MRKVWTVLLVAVLCVAFAVPSANAAEKKAKTTAKSPAAAERGGQESTPVTQAQLAQMLVEVLGLSRFLPANPSAQECFALLLDNSIMPKEGWNADRIVVKADLARVIVQAMKKQGDIKNPDDSKEWIDYLKGIGVPLDAVGETVYYVDPLAEPIALNVVAGNVDPMTKRHRFNPIDETQYGVDMHAIVRIISQFEFVDGEFRPPRVTPD